VEEFICNECRFDHKDITDWVIEGPRQIGKDSIISVNHYVNSKKGAIFNPVEKKIIKPSENKGEK
jgi:NADH-quinone oxidoreductase subunit G